MRFVIPVLRLPMRIGIQQAYAAERHPALVLLEPLKTLHWIGGILMLEQPTILL